MTDASSSLRQATPLRRNDYFYSEVPTWQGPETGQTTPNPDVDVLYTFALYAAAYNSSEFGPDPLWNESKEGRDQAIQKFREQYPEPGRRNAILAHLNKMWPGRAEPWERALKGIGPMSDDESYPSILPYQFETQALVVCRCKAILHNLPPHSRTLDYLPARYAGPESILGAGANPTRRQPRESFNVRTPGPTDGPRVMSNGQDDPDARDRRGPLSAYIPQVATLRNGILPTGLRRVLQGAG